MKSYQLGIARKQARSPRRPKIAHVSSFHIVGPLHHAWNLPNHEIFGLEELDSDAGKPPSKNGPDPSLRSNGYDLRLLQVLLEWFRCWFRVWTSEVHVYSGA